MPSLFKKRTQTKQLEIENLDEMVWRSTPLGKYMNSTNNRTTNVIPSYELKKIPRSWVVRIPGSLIITGAERGGFQTIVKAWTLDKAWDAATKSEEWQLLPFRVNQMTIFQKEPL